MEKKEKKKNTLNRGGPADERRRAGDGKRFLKKNTKKD